MFWRFRMACLSLVKIDIERCPRSSVLLCRDEFCGSNRTRARRVRWRERLAVITPGLRIELLPGPSFTSSEAQPSLSSAASHVTRHVDILEKVFNRH
jgi:hypothetical protein